MIAGWLCDDVEWSSIEGEQFVGDQEHYFEPDQQDQQGYFENQGKYSLGLYSFITNHDHITWIMFMQWTLNMTFNQHVELSVLESPG